MANDSFTIQNNTTELIVESSQSTNYRLLSIRHEGKEIFGIDREGNLHVKGNIVLNKEDPITAMMTEAFIPKTKEYKSRLESLIIIEENNDGTEI